jgi:hypothetical protein
LQQQQYPPQHPSVSRPGTQQQQQSVTTTNFAKRGRSCGGGQSSITFGDGSGTNYSLRSNNNAIGFGVSSSSSFGTDLFNNNNHSNSASNTFQQQQPLQQDHQPSPGSRSQTAASTSITGTGGRAKTGQSQNATSSSISWAEYGGNDDQFNQQQRRPRNQIPGQPTPFKGPPNSANIQQQPQPQQQNLQFMGAQDIYSNNNHDWNHQQNPYQQQQQYQNNNVGGFAAPPPLAVNPLMLHNNNNNKPQQYGYNSNQNNDFNNNNSSNQNNFNNSNSLRSASVSSQPQQQQFQQQQQQQPTMLSISQQQQQTHFGLGMGGPTTNFNRSPTKGGGFLQQQNSVSSDGNIDSYNNNNSQQQIGGGVCAFPPPLDPNSPADLTYIRGPTPTSNWVIRGRLCCGAAPNVVQARYIEALGKERFAFLISLREVEPDLDTIEAMTAAAGGLRPQVFHFPLQDGRAFKNTQQATEFLAFVRRVVLTLEKEPMARAYVFCQNGHGRTGMFVSIALGLAYGLTGMRATNLCDRLHELRVNSEGQSSPQTQDQRTAVQTLMKA